MKKIFILLFAIGFAISCTHKPPKKVLIIPEPLMYEAGNKAFCFTDNTTIFHNNTNDLNQQAQYLSDLLQNVFNIRTNIVSKSPSMGNIIELKILQNTDTIGNEGYYLDIKKNHISISSPSPKGIFYGLQSLFQIIASNALADSTLVKNIEIPTLKIVDKPRFKYRGMHLDVCRHMFPVDFIKQYIDLLALYKFNTFHWHLTEDQGWRIEIKKYPKLTEVGAYRDETRVGHAGIEPEEYDGIPYGGYYTQDEVKEIVAYAAQRQITIIPEIEMPGHSQAALAAYPELGCADGPFEVATTWGVFEDIYCADDSTFVFLENVLFEVMDLFPSEYIHIGGDEAPKAQWEKCPICQAVMKRENLKNEHELQSYFITRIEKFLNSYGRNIIGWDEILEGGLAPNATVMSWRGTEGGIAAASMGHDAIMTPWSHCYFDHYQADPEKEQLAIGGFTTLEKVYNYEPVPDTLTDDIAKHIIGAQANVWTEYITTPEQVEYMVLPRMAALSEVNWTKKKDWENFKKKIEQHFRLYNYLELNYCDHPY